MYGLLIVALQQQVSFIFFFFFFFFIFLFLFFALKFSLIGIELMKNMHFTTLGLGTELGIIIACIGGKRPWLESSYLLFNQQLNQNLWPSGWAFSKGAACSFFFFAFAYCCLCFCFLGDTRSQQYKPEICVCCRAVLQSNCYISSLDQYFGV